MPDTGPRRVEFGATRTVCACKVCVANCRCMPGYLIPSDLGRLCPGGVNPGWAREHLRASPGATMLRINGDGSHSLIRVPTLVPAHRPDGSCHWLDGRSCSVHDAAPFGCAFFDCVRDTASANVLSGHGLRAIIADRLEGGMYARTWDMLNAEGLVAPPIENRRAALAALVESERRRGRDPAGRPRRPR
jgi:hypothetical protein